MCGCSVMGEKEGWKEGLWQDPLKLLGVQRRMLTSLIVRMVLHGSKLNMFYTLTMCNVLCVNYISIKLFKDISMFMLDQLNQLYSLLFL